MKSLALVVVMVALPALATPIDMKKLERLLGLGRTGDGPTTAPLPASPLQWRLMGTMRARNGFSLAAVECATKSVTLAVGDVHEGVEVLAIEQQFIVVRRDGREEKISWRPGSGVPSPPPSRPRTLSRDTVNQYLSNPAEIINQVRMVPAFVDGQLVGFRAHWVKEGSLLASLGLKSGDVLLKVNGFSLNSRDTMSLFQQLHTTRRFEIELERNGQRLVESVELDR
jgi:general secretion pathway protein C